MKVSGTNPNTPFVFQKAYRLAWTTAFRLGVITPMSDVANEWDDIRTSWIQDVSFEIERDWSHLTYEEQIRKFADMFDCTVVVKPATRNSAPLVRFYGAKEFMRDLIWNLDKYTKRDVTVTSDGLYLEAHRPPKQTVGDCWNYSEHRAMTKTELAEARARWSQISD